MKAGAAWEFEVERWNRQYLIQGQAVVFRCHPGVKVVEARIIWDSRGPPDFVGFLAGCTPVAFDCKEISSPRFPFGDLPHHQADAFEWVLQGGGVPFILVSRLPKAGGGKFFLPWVDIRDRYGSWRTMGGGARGASVVLDEFRRIDERGWLPLVTPPV